MRINIKTYVVDKNTRINTEQRGIIYTQLNLLLTAIYSSALMVDTARLPETLHK